MNITMSEDQGPRKVSFPMLMRSKTEGYVVLFVNAHAGMRVTDHDNRPATFHIESDWISAYDSDCWEIYQGSITLSN